MVERRRNRIPILLRYDYHLDIGSILNLFVATNILIVIGQNPRADIFL